MTTEPIYRLSACLGSDDLSLRMNLQASCDLQAMLHRALNTMDPKNQPKDMMTLCDSLAEWNQKKLGNPAP